MKSLFHFEFRIVLEAWSAVIVTKPNVLTLGFVTTPKQIAS